MSVLTSPLLAALLCLSAGASAAPASGASTGPARPSLVSGGGETQAGYLVAGSEGAQWALPGGPRVIAAPGAEARVIHAPQPLTLGPGATTPGYTVVVRSGRVRVEVPADAKSAIVITTRRNVSAIVKSGAVDVVATGAVTAIANLRGETTTAASSGAYRPLAAGTVQEISAAGATTRPAIGAPTALTGRRLLLASGGHADVSGLGWTAPAGATSHRIELMRAGDAAPVARAATSGARMDRPFENVEAGQYQVRVFAVDALGLSSDKPLEVPLQVLGATIPEGAYVDPSGVIRLAPGQKVRFSHAEGLEMRSGKAGKYARASSVVGLLHGEATTVHLRMPETGEVQSVRLAPRGLRARVEVGPKTATWPKDPIQIRIRVEDADGGPVPTWLEAKPRVLLGHQVLQLPFARRNGALTATVPPRGGAGPWVVRVEVEDQFGLPLGRDFVEVVSQPGPAKPTRITTRILSTGQTKVSKR